MKKKREDEKYREIENMKKKIKNQIMRKEEKQRWEQGKQTAKDEERRTKDINRKRKHRQDIEDKWIRNFQQDENYQMNDEEWEKCKYNKHRHELRKQQEKQRWGNRERNRTR